MPSTPRIELPRPAIIALIGALILAATFAITKAGGTADSVSAPPAPAAGTNAQGSSQSTGTTTTTAKAAKAAKPKQPAVVPGAGLPSDVARAMNAGKVVVLFFYDPAAADDQATRSAVRAVRAGAGRAAARVRLFQDVVARISDYRRVVGSIGISQSPALVVIDRNRKAELLQGYLDSGTIEQTVRDAL
jgi:hypothetical protein